MTHAPERGRLGTDAAGLVVVLDLTGRIVAELEDRVALLEDALTAERAERARVEDLLARLRAYDDTTDVTPPRPDTTDTRPHDPPRTHS